MTINISYSFIYYIGSAKDHEYAGLQRLFGNYW